MAKKLKIPDKVAWMGYHSDLDVKHFHKIAFGKSINEIQEYFGGIRSIARMDELLFAPKPVFQYYVFAFADFLTSDAARGDADSASPFLTLLEAREKRDPGSVAEIYGALHNVVEFVASNQEYFEADVNIYGNFRDRAEHIRKMCIEPH